MRTLVVGIVGLGLLSLTACMPVASPVVGMWYTEAKYGNMATNVKNASKEGKACATTVMGLVAQGDASIAAAKAAGGITEVSSIDHSAKSILGIMGEWCTIVKGN